ncbi:MAG: molybdate ABC transporter substrate-binding protein [Acidimicrobiales bacterium]|nr:molybdate ABC transporter substrate-binding protein [Actinomycetota bacterium]
MRQGVWAGVVLIALVPACAPADRVAGARPGGSTPLTGTVTVLAAASLTETFEELGRRFQAVHPGVDLTFSFGPSSTLVRQVQEGAPADVVAVADEGLLQPVADAGLSSSPAIFARNRLALVVAAGNPEGVDSLAALARPGLAVVLCAPEVPCGRLAAEALRRAGIHVEPRSLEPDVKAVVAKVALGEADAGIVYVTDVSAGGSKVEGVAIPPAENAVATYPIATLRRAPNPAAAAAFVDFVRSDEGRALLTSAGFEV